MSFMDVQYGPLGQVNNMFQNNLAQNQAGMAYQQQLQAQQQAIAQQNQQALNNTFSNFGQQTDYYSQLAAAYGRQTGGFNAAPAPAPDYFGGYGIGGFNPSNVDANPYTGGGGYAPGSPGDLWAQAFGQGGGGGGYSPETGQPLPYAGSSSYGNDPNALTPAWGDTGGYYNPYPTAGVSNPAFDAITKQIGPQTFTPGEYPSYLTPPMPPSPWGGGSGYAPGSPGDLWAQAFGSSSQSKNPAPYDQASLYSGIQSLLQSGQPMQPTSPGDLGYAPAFNRGGFGQGFDPYFGSTGSGGGGGYAPGSPGDLWAQAFGFSSQPRNPAPYDQASLYSGIQSNLSKLDPFSAGSYPTPQPYAQDIWGLSRAMQLMNMAAASDGGGGYGLYSPQNPGGAIYSPEMGGYFDANTGSYFNPSTYNAGSMAGYQWPQALPRQDFYIQQDQPSPDTLTPADRNIPWSPPGSLGPIY